MNKIAIVVQRCHSSIVGGSETLAWEYAQLLRDAYAVEVLTSTATNYSTWASDLPEGRDDRDGIAIHRFRAEPARSAAWAEQHWQCLRAAESGFIRWHLPRQEEWIRRQGPFCPDLLRHLERHGAEYRVVLFVTYLYPTTYFGLGCVERERAILVPTLHDEPFAYLTAFGLAARSASRIVWLTEAEQRLGRRLWGELPGAVVAMPVAIDLAKPVPSDAPYLLCSGRICSAKGCDQLLDHFRRYKESAPGPLKLVFSGQDDLGMPKRADVEHRGMLSREQLLSTMAGATAFVMPSPYESFSIATLEAMAQKTPVLVNRRSEVLADHAALSGGGFSYGCYADFAEALDALLADESRRQLGAKARAYVVDRFQRDTVASALRRVVAATAAPMARAA